MDSLHFPRLAVIALALVSTVGLARGARAATDTDLRCQSAIGDAAQAFAAARLSAFVACNNQRASGDTCDGARRDRMVAAEARSLAKRVAGACSVVALADLGFPGRCLDLADDGFSVGDLTGCIEDTDVGFTDVALALEYPFLGATLAGDERRCQRELGRAASRFVAVSMRVRSRCLDARLRGALSDAVYCRAEVQPYGTGTGDYRTDHAINQASARLFSRIADACWRANLPTLGFPGSCSGFVLGDLGVDDVQRCVRRTHYDVVDAMIAAAYPLAPTAPPNPSPSPTPALVSLEIFPASRTRPVGTFQNYAVAGTYEDGSARNLTQRVQYTSSDETVAVAPNLEGNRGRVNAVGPGTALITATEPVTGITSNAAILNVTLCAHDKCLAGTALDAGCEPCVTAICAADSSCCSTDWGEGCVDAVASVCGASCGAAAGP
jgi:hypothetical protein